MDISTLERRIETLEQKVDIVVRRLDAVLNEWDCFQAPDECRKHTCSYYQHYLAQGPPELNHEGFHAAEKKCSFAQEWVIRHLETHENCGGITPWDNIAAFWERKVRA